MNIRSKGRRRRPNRSSAEGILTPSNRLFEKISKEVSLKSLKEDVIASIRNRESLIDRIREILVAENKNKKKARSRINAEAKSNQTKKMFYALHNASLCVVEAIITINLTSQSMGCQDSTNCLSASITRPNYQSPPGQNMLTFSWMGQNYLIKMMTDLQFMCKFKEIMEILLPEKKTLYRNPFLIPLDLDEVMGYEPDVSSVSSDSKNNRMTRIPWEINVPRVKRAASRILFEEHRSVYGDSNVLHVFPKSINKKGGDFVQIILPPSPKLDLTELEKIVTFKDLSFDDALIIGCVRLLLGCDIEGVPVHGDSIPKQSIFKLARQPIEIIFHELCVPENEVKAVSIGKRVLFNIYSMMARNGIKAELLITETSNSISSLKTWLCNVISREWEMQGLKSKDAEVMGTKVKMGEKTKNYVENTKFPCEKDVKSSLTIDINTKCIDIGIDVDVQIDDVCHSQKVCMDTVSPAPIWKTVSVTEGSHKVNVFEGNLVDSIHTGDVIRIGHPLHSSDYTVSRIENSCFFIAEAFDHSSVLRHELEQEDENISRLYSPSKRINKANLEYKGISKEDQSNDEIKSEVLNVKKPRTISEARIWKVVPFSDDKRLEWRKEYDNGFVSRIPSAKKGYKEHFGIKLNWKDVERCCSDTKYNPDTSIHQQRLHYFECVSLDDIILETYKTVCQSWHPTTSTIDNVKWAKLARIMKFLSTVTNSNHEVDMAFFRHSHQRKLDAQQFKGVLLDMALQKYSSARYDGGVSGKR